MLFLISSAPDTTEFKTAFRTAREMNAQVCLLQNSVYASRGLDEKNLFVLQDDIQLRGIDEAEVSAEIIDYGRLVDLMIESDKVIGLF